MKIHHQRQLIAVMILLLSGISLNSAGIEPPTPRLTSPPQLIIDRMEGLYAVVEFGDEWIEIPRRALPLGASEGSAIQLVLAPASRQRGIAIERLHRLEALGLEEQKTGRHFMAEPRDVISNVQQPIKLKSIDL